MSIFRDNTRYFLFSVSFKNAVIPHILDFVFFVYECVCGKLESMAWKRGFNEAVVRSAVCIVPVFFTQLCSSVHSISSVIL